MSEPLRQRFPQPPMSPAAASDDVSIPLLTERLSAPPTLPPLDLDTTLPLGTDTLRIDLPIGPTTADVVQLAPQPAPTPAATAGSHWSRIEIELRESVLTALAEQLPLEVNDIVRRHVSVTAEAAIREIVEPLTARVAAETRLAIASSLREIVDRAVKSELARLRALKPRN